MECELQDTDVNVEPKGQLFVLVFACTSGCRALVSLEGDVLIVVYDHDALDFLLEKLLIDHKITFLVEVVVSLLDYEALLQAS